MTVEISGPDAPTKRASTSTHPWCPLSPSEIRRAADILRSSWPSDVELRFKIITLLEPEKKAFLPYLNGEYSEQIAAKLDRKAFTTYSIRKTDRSHEAIVNLSTSQVEENVRLGPNEHAGLDYEEILGVEKTALEHDDVRKEIEKLNLPAGTVVCADPWPYGSDGIDDDGRLFRVFMYMRDPANASESDSNYYAFPLAISPVIDGVTLELRRIEYLPTGVDNTKPESLRPWTSRAPNEYINEHQELRKDLKPLQVVQPEGASFQITRIGETGYVLAWQKWTFQIGFNQREGMVLYNVRYDGRPLFYRVSLSDMNIPYADPRHPFNKKSAFDLGDGGAGAMANDLKLGCDCLGSIYYLNGWVSGSHGEPVEMPNCVCIHEQDGGIGWKHMNYRTGRAAVVRSRELVLQSIITVANYEYILAFQFNQAGEMSYEVRATGILSTQPIDDGVTVPWGTIVHPGVLAVHHQHIFSLRVDPMIGGPHNRLAFEEAHPLPLDESNSNGNGYYTEETVIEKSSALHLNAAANRVFKIQNSSILNPINNQPIAYKIQVPDFQKILSHPSSLNYKRAEFSSHNIYVTQHRDKELYSGGWYTNQSRGGTGVRNWADRADNVKDDDIVVWVQFGINHIPRIEDFPVMPCEKIAVHFKPVNFFDKNPAIDVPPSTQTFNQSVLLSETHRQGSHVVTVQNENGKLNGVCCDGEADEKARAAATPTASATATEK